ncbi:MAG: UDP-N-acetylmuramoyl-tripeptide--D-alanyl-D-alanine ligase [Rickettsiales bacterium]|nr:UDP-N-acetylmuramoyl-tripeptide--D-alanyl-D-alanine ligase [Rickettsiales bacterium]
MQFIYANIQYLIFFGFVALNIKRTLVLSHFFQQEEYDNTRFLKLIFHKLRYIDRKFTLVTILVFASTIWFKQDLIFAIIYLCFILYIAFNQFNPLRNGKKPLVITKRLRLIMIVCLVINIVAGLALISQFQLNLHYLFYILLIQALPICLVIANFILTPVEKLVQKQFYNEAKSILSKFNPKVIAITGSYGKTSTKYILNHILASNVKTLATPGSVNTVMGIVRIIREQLKPEHKYFIVEMGAYGIGSIDRLCRLVSPLHGIITAIGVAHLERYKKTENVAKAKFELSNYVANSNGFLVLNNDQIKASYIEQYNQVDTANSACVSKEEGLNYQIVNAINTVDGVKFELKYNNSLYKVFAPIYGLIQIENIALAFVMALKIGLKSDAIIASLSKLPQIKHRLEVKKQANHIIIDDAYNSNPDGFKAALDVVDMFGAANKDARKIIVTPGMVEMGDDHYIEHKNLGKMIAEKCDILVVILPERIQSLIENFKINSKGKILMQFDDFKSAKAWLDQNSQSNDIILFENDLPDIYESKIAF